MQIEVKSPEYHSAYVIDGSTSQIMEIKARMAEHLSGEQSHILSDVLHAVLLGDSKSESNEIYIQAFLNAKRVEGCTERTIDYYKSTINLFDKYIKRPFRLVDANDIRSYLSWLKYERTNSDVSVNNNRRNLSTFFQWLEDEDVIRKSPVKKVKAIREEKADKEPFSDTDVVLIRRHCTTLRGKAIVELLLSSGMRVGELAGLDIEKVNLQTRECVVFGKGRKYRTCYFSAEAAVAIEDYLESRNDNNPALFVSAQKSNGEVQRLSVGAVERWLRELGKKAGVEKCHPHRFRRTMATNNLRRGMKVEEIQLLLGHNNIETTMIYAKLDKEIVKTQVRRFI